MPDRCVCYTTDVGYLFASFVSGLQARAHTDPARVDIVILGFDLDQASLAAFEPACRQAGIILVRCQRSQIHDRPVLLARLFLDELLPDQYRTFLYMDGDTTISDSLMPLIDFDVSGGRFLAAYDPMAFSAPDENREGRQIRAYFQSIGLPPERATSYFNSGVILADRAGWARIGAAAWATYAGRGSWTFSDQDVLNIAGGASLLPMSLSWNFPIYMRNARVEHATRPRVVHYMSKPKPWEGVFPPWDRAVHQIYLDAVRRFPAIDAYRTRMPARRQLRYHAQQRYKRLMETFSWGFGNKHRRILDYERRIAVLPAATEPA